MAREDVRSAHEDLAVVGNPDLEPRQGAADGPEAERLLAVHRAEIAIVSLIP